MSRLPRIKLQLVQQKKTRQNVLHEKLKATVTDWLELIPRVPSHYCRASSSREYVDNSFVSKQNMHRIYKAWCEEKGKTCTSSLTLFKNILKEKKISVHKPRKDQCDTCIAFLECKTISQETYDDHIKKEKDGRAAKAKLKESVCDENLVVTMDLQSVLTCPKLLASSSYYKLKLQLHNFTIYALNNKEVSLYVWDESNGGVSSNEFASCIIDYLTGKLNGSIKTLILISDGCNYQNRNKCLASVLSDFAVQHKVTVHQLILEKGHTMMEADSVHSALEHYFYPPIYAPSEYIARMRMARRELPYNIKFLDYKFFKKYDMPSNFTSIRPGKRKLDPVVVDIRQLKYLPDGKVLFTLDYSENWQTLDYKREVRALESYKPLYKTQLPISDDKDNHLQELKAVIEKDHHQFYDTLPHSNKKKTQKIIK